MIPMIDLKDGINRERKSVQVKRMVATVFLFLEVCLCGAAIGVMVAAVDRYWFSALVAAIGFGTALTCRWLFIL